MWGCGHKQGDGRSRCWKFPGGGTVNARKLSTCYNISRGSKEAACLLSGFLHSWEKNPTAGTQTPSTFSF